MASLVAVGCAASPPPRPAWTPPPPAGDDVLLQGLRGVPGAEGLGWIVVREGRIAAIGSPEDVALPAGSLLRKSHDLGGGLLLPGLWDAHAHVMSGGLAAVQVDLSGAESMAEVQDAVAAWASSHPDAEWVLGRGWGYGIAPDGEPTRGPLDEILPDRPAMLESYDGHAIWLNGAALAAAGIDAGTADPPGGRSCVERTGGRRRGCCWRKRSGWWTGWCRSRRGTSVGRRCGRGWTTSPRGG